MLNNTIMEENIYILTKKSHTSRKNGISEYHKYRYNNAALQFWLSNHKLKRIFVQRQIKIYLHMLKYVEIYRAWDKREFFGKVILWKKCRSFEYNKDKKKRKMYIKILHIMHLEMQYESMISKSITY